MPVHDWTRVPAGVFHDFHNAWIIHLKEALNRGVLPKGYYAMAEQQFGQGIADILALNSNAGESGPEPHGSVAVAAPPRVGRKVSSSEASTFRAIRRTVAIRHVSRHQLVAMIEILSPANKDRRSSLDDFVAKACSALRHGCSLLVVDLFPPGSFDPRGIHEAVWGSFDSDDFDLPPDKPLTLASYVAALTPEAWVEHVAVDDSLPAMPLFLRTDLFVNTPLEENYLSAYEGVPDYWRGVIEGR